MRLAPRLAGLTLAALAAYLAVNLLLVWRASREDEARPTQAIVVLGSAEYDGVPSPDLGARLSHALALWHRKVAPLIVVTGGKRPGDVTTEAAASASWLGDHGVPDAAILQEVTGRNTWQSLHAAAGFLLPRGIRQVVLVSDPYHNERITLMARSAGLTPCVSPTRTSPIKGARVIPYFAKETAEVSIGRIIGFPALGRFDAYVGGRLGLR